MPRSWTVRRLIVAVALVTIVLAAARVHLSLGSLLLGTLGPALLRTMARIDRAQVDGAGEPPRSRAVVARFAIEALRAALILLLALSCAGAIAAIVLADGPRRSHDPRYSEERVTRAVVIASVGAIPVIGWATRRLAKRATPATEPTPIANQTPAAPPEEGGAGG